MNNPWTPKAKDEPGDRQVPVTYIEAREIGFGFLPLIEEGDAPPSEEHYAEARRLEADYQARNSGGAN